MILSLVGLLRLVSLVFISLWFSGKEDLKK